MVTVGLEREIKLNFDVDETIPDLAEAASVGGNVVSLEKRSLDAEYFDTADLRLTRWGCSLRHRSDEGWMVKLPDPAGDESPEVLMRTEVHFSGAGTSPPVEAVALVAPFARGASLRSVARLRTERQPVRVDDADGNPIAELVEDDVGVELPGQPAWHFRMVEIELADGHDVAEVASVIDRYRSAGAHTTSQSKLARALGSAAAASADVVVPLVSSSPTAREVIHAAIARSVQSHLLHLPIALVGEGTEGVHQARVALRRLRSDLRTFGPLLDPLWVEEFSAEVRWMGDQLGAVRDADVRIEVLHRVIDEAPAVHGDDMTALAEHLRVERNQAHQHLLTVLDSSRCTDLLDRLVDAAADPRTAPQADDPAEENIPALVDHPWRKLRKTVGRLGPESSHDDIHRIRIKAKRCRYAAEAVEPVMGKPARRLAKAMKRIQESLGDLNDAIVIRAHLAILASQHEELGYAAGELSGLLVARAAHCEGDFRRQWIKANRIKLPDKRGR